MIRQTIHSIQKKLHRVTEQVYNSNAPKKRLFSSSFLSRKRHEIYAWGDATHGQIGNGMPHGAVGIPSLVEELAADLRFGSIGTGQFHSMALTEQGHLYSWGRAGFQDESPDKSLTSVTPLRITGPWNDEAIVSASGGRAHTAVVSKKGNVYSWGNGHNFQLGHGDGKDQSVPKLVNALLGQQAVKISSGWGHNLILTTDGKVWSWGWNQDGQLGIGSTDHSAVPRLAPGLTGVTVIDIAAGSDHSLLLTSEGTVIAFGLGEMGQLGRGNKDTSTGPVLVQFPPNVKITSIAAGFAHCLAISDKGELYTWGWNSDGQLGLDDTDDRTTPTVIPIENKTTLIACGRVNSLCYTDANLLYSWGSAQSGRLGTGSRAHQLTPDIVDELSQPELKVLALSCGLDHVLALVERE